MILKKQAYPVMAWVLVLCLFGCAEPTIKPSDDLKRIQEIDRFIITLEEFVRGREVSSIKGSFAPEAGRTLDGLDRAYKSIKKPGLDLVIDRIMIDGEEVRVAVHWEFRWTNSSNGNTAIVRGNATLELEGSDPLRIRSIKGDDPFLAPLNGAAAP